MNVSLDISKGSHIPRTVQTTAQRTGRNQGVIWDEVGLSCWKFPRNQPGTGFPWTTSYIINWVLHSQELRGCHPRENSKINTLEQGPADPLDKEKVFLGEQLLQTFG